jgi:hypothetical protein
LNTEPDAFSTFCSPSISRTGGVSNVFIFGASYKSDERNVDGVSFDRRPREKSTTMNPPKLETIFVAVCFLLVTSGFQKTSAAAAGNSQAKLDRARFVRRVAEVEVRPVEHYSRVLIQLVWECTENTSFSSQLTNGPNKLYCLSRTSPYDLVKCNILAYWAHSKATGKNQVLVVFPWFPLF